MLTSLLDLLDRGLKTPKVFDRRHLPRHFVEKSCTLQLCDEPQPGFSRRHLSSSSHFFGFGHLLHVLGQHTMSFAYLRASVRSPSRSKAPVPVLILVPPFPARSSFSSCTSHGPFGTCPSHNSSSNRHKCTSTIPDAAPSICCCRCTRSQVLAFVPGTSDTSWGSTTSLENTCRVVSCRLMSRHGVSWRVVLWRVVAWHVVACRGMACCGVAWGVVAYFDQAQ